jgi:hypothetical protein
MSCHLSALSGPKKWTQKGYSHRLVFAADMVDVDSPAIMATAHAAGSQFRISLRLSDAEDPMFKSIT